MTPYYSDDAVTILMWVAVALFVAGLVLIVRSAREEAEQAKDREIARGLATMRYRRDEGVADLIAGRWNP